MWEEPAGGDPGSPEAGTQAGTEDAAARPSWRDTVDEWLPPEETRGEEEPEIPEEAMEAGEAGEIPEEAEPEPVPREIVATNRAIRLSCTLAAACGPLALFLLFVEHESRAIRRFSLQSTGLSAMHLAAAVLAGILGASLSALPVVGTVANVICWIAYLSVMMSCLILRIRMMAAAWQGVGFRLPLLGGWLERQA